MPLIDDFELPLPFAGAIKERVTDMSPDSVLAFAKAQPSWFRGLRIIRKQTARLQRRMVDTMLVDGKKIPAELLEFMAFSDLNCKLISHLPLESLQFFLEQFQILFGRRKFLLGLLLDDREEVQQFARQEMENFAGDKDDRETEQERATGADDLQENSVRIKRYKEECAALKKEATAAARRNNRLSKKINQLKEQLAKQQLVTAQQKNKIDQCQQMADEQQDRLAAMEAELSHKIQQGVSAEMTAAISNWLSFPKEVDSLVSEQNTESLLDRVEQALERQAEVDKHSGNLRVLRQRLASLERCRESVEQSRQHSLQVIPELAVLSRELDEQILAIQKKIDPCPPAESHLAPWLRTINEAASPQQLDKLDRLTTQLRKQDIFSEQDVLLLRKKSKEARERFNDRFKYVEQKTVPIARHLTLLVDGHNVILGADSYSLFKSRECRLTEPKKRQLLTQQSRRAFADRENMSVVIFFDSPEYSETDIAANIKEIYSGGGSEEQRADNAIIHFLENRHLKSDQALNRYVLITDDRELAARAARFGVTVQSVFEYGVMLRAS
jgi:hypothetical protein